MAFTEKLEHQDCIHGHSQAGDGCVCVWRLHRHWNWLKRIFCPRSKLCLPRSLLCIVKV